MMNNRAESFNDDGDKMESYGGAMSKNASYGKYKQKNYNKSSGGGGFGIGSMIKSLFQKSNTNSDSKESKK